MKINWLHVVNSVAGGLAIVAGLNPALFGPYAPQAAMAIGLATIGANVLHAVVTSGEVPPSQAAKALFMAIVVGVMFTLVVGLSACKTVPTPTEQAGIVVAVDIATGAAIQEGTAPAGYAARAAKFKAIAVEVKTVNDAGTATLATLAADIAPQIAKLPPADQLAAHALIAALTPYLNAETSGNPTLQTAQATLDVILQAVIDSCGAYGA